VGNKNSKRVEDSPSSLVTWLGGKKNNGSHAVDATGIIPLDNDRVSVDVLSGGRCRIRTSVT